MIIGNNIAGLSTNELCKMDHRITQRAYQRINYIYEHGFYKKVIDWLIGSVLYH
jgi:hypothetical protein